MSCSPVRMIPVSVTVGGRYMTKEEEGTRMGDNSESASNPCAGALWLGKRGE